MTQPMLPLDQLKRAWIDNAVRYFDNFMPKGETFTVELFYPALDAPPHPNHYGALMATLRTTGRIKEVGRVKSTRPERNGAKISLWQVIA